MATDLREMLLELGENSLVRAQRVNVGRAEGSRDLFRKTCIHLSLASMAAEKAGDRRKHVGG
jgi:hypothetical protein